MSPRPSVRPNAVPYRGEIGPTPALSARDDETFLDYIRDVRSILMMERSPAVCTQADSELKAAGVEFEPTKDSVEAVRSVIRRNAPDAGIWARVYRSTQEAFWSRVVDSYDQRRNEFLKMLDQYEKSGPGTVALDPQLTYPEYAYVETHRQNGGYVGDPLAGLRFDYGTRIFHGDTTESGDTLHAGLAAKAPLPVDGKINRVMDIGCSIGQLACQLKRRFPDAEVWGSDISGPMVKYAHYRAVKQNLDIHFVQCAAENLDRLPAQHFDLITAYILFHEVPLWVTEQAIRHVHRLLRPGGTFWISDFPTRGHDPNGLDYTGFLAAIDSADNSEPYAPDFVNCGIEEKLETVGFKLRYTKPDDINIHGRVCDK